MSGCRDAAAPASRIGTVLFSPDSGRLPSSAPSEDPMTERLESNRPGFRKARRRAPASRAGHARGSGTVPVPSPTGVPVEGEPTLLGFPAEFAEEADEAAGPSGDAALDTSPGLTVVRRPDPVASAALFLAGVAANVSLLLSWSP